jgi:hypothetical protein
LPYPKGRFDNQREVIVFKRKERHREERRKCGRTNKKPQIARKITTLIAERSRDAISNFKQDRHLYKQSYD